MPFWARLLVSTAAACWALAAGADNGALITRGQQALEQNDCVAMAEARRALKPEAEQQPGGEAAELAGRLVDAMLAMPGCGETRFRLLRSRPVNGADALIRDRNGADQ